MDATEEALDREDYESANSLEGLGTVLEENGCDIEPSMFERLKYQMQDIDEEDARSRKIYQKAQDDWWQLTREQEIEEKRPQYVPEHGFSVDENEIYVLGFPHSAPGVELSNKCRSFLQDRISEYKKDGTVLVEENKSDIECEDVTELDDITHFMEEVEDHVQEQGKWSFQAERMKRLGLLKLFDITGTEGNIRQPVLKSALDQKTYDYWRTGFESMQEPEKWMDFYNACKADKLPLKLQQDYDRRHNPALNVLQNERSIYMAEKAIETAEQEKEPVHLVVGMGHAPQLEEYFSEKGEKIDTDL